MVKLLKIVSSDKPLKKWTAIFKLDNDKEKKVHFGYYNIGMNDYGSFLAGHDVRTRL